MLFILLFKYLYCIPVLLFSLLYRIFLLHPWVLLCWGDTKTSFNYLTLFIRSVDLGRPLNMYCRFLSVADVMNCRNSKSDAVIKENSLIVILMLLALITW